MAYIAFHANSEYFKLQLLRDGHRTDNLGMTKKYVTQLIIVDADGEIITAANGQISGNQP